ncbi:hypothetical protein V2J09_024118 [Rumex salicifolius]
MNESYRNSVQLHDVEVEEDHSSLESNVSLRVSVDALTINDVSPIETARARFLRIVVDHFIIQHAIEVLGSEAGYTLQHEQDKLHKRKSSEEVRYEGDPQFVLPLMYVANMYETLVNEANVRLASLDGCREKTLGVALEAAGGLYRKLAKKFPKKGPFTFKRRELATSLETRARFPELVVQEEKRVRFVVVNGLDIIEKPDTISADDAEWFKRLTGRSEVSVSAQDYKFYSPRPKYRRIVSTPLPSMSGLPSYSAADSSSPMASPQAFRSIPENQEQPKQDISQLMHQPHFHLNHQDDHPPHHDNQVASHFSHDQCIQPSRLPEIVLVQSSPTIPQTMVSLQSLAGSHSVGRMHLMPTSPAKFCDECGTPFLRETSKFCSECGTKRLGI